MIENDFENKALLNLNKTLKDLNKTIKEGANLINNKLRKEMTPEEADKFKAYLTKFLKLKSEGKHKEAAELERKFRDGQ